ncbi:DUF4861 family protein [Fulvivirgaceae bacterium PWU5]|uniref:DUF4861 family protein n=1 Tax=Dawidia cretensis TaxID=2782350 RepID=A0AAP2DYM6_9BACT|nr:DUF4861 family protein [Dawidia cretensis]MBT1708452.1 DUF4861 family protein [Dawidia cretensis]
MMKNSILLFSIVALAACSKPRHKFLTVQNPLETERTEIVSIPVVTLDSLFPSFTPGNLIVQASEDDTEHCLAQWIDEDGDGKPEAFLFEASLKGKERKTYILKESEHSVRDTTLEGTYGRFVPERIDDFAWENNRVAFRTYGPEAQRLVDAGEKGGTLSSGIDCWLKRVEYGVIDAWYAKNTKGGSYHKDDGEGYDPYHVGASRGCGGLGVLVGDSLYVSKNFVTHRVLADGPLRTTFELTYAPWSAAGAMVRERKVVSIDRNNQLSRIEAFVTSDSTLVNVTLGITLHDKKGEVKTDSAQGWFRYWEPMDDSELGTAIVIDPARVLRYADYRTTKKDMSHLYVMAAAPRQDAVVYYTGFGWKKAGKVASAETWDLYLQDFAQRLTSPVTVHFEK